MIPLQEVWFLFYRWNQFKVIPVLRTGNLPQIFCDVGRRLTAPHGTKTNISHSLFHPGSDELTIDY